MFARSKLSIRTLIVSRFVFATSACIGLATLGCSSGEEDTADDDTTADDETTDDGASGRDAGSGSRPGSDGGPGQGDAGRNNAAGGNDAGRVNTAPDGGATARDGGGRSDAGASSDAGSGGNKPLFSFFMASQAGLERLSGQPKGFGGDLRFGKSDGLSGADEICRQLAEASMPGNGKTWRAFLSVTKGPDGSPVNAIDRIGEGPWYDRKERVFAMNKAALLSARPQGAHAVIVNDFPNEDGVPNHDPGTGIIDNHNTLTGSTAMGTVDTRGLRATCQDWTSSQADGGTPRCGVSWPRGQLAHWISTLDEGGCAPGATPPGAESGERGTVGALGGYGGFYCFALTP